MLGLGLVKTGVALHYKLRVKKDPPAVVGPWLRDELQTLGPLSAKVGQWASNRSDIFGDFAKELADLQQNAAPMDPSEVSAVRETFKDSFDIEPTPLASASVGQVHVGTYGNRKVAVKIQRPGILESLDADERVLKTFAWLLKWVKAPSAEDAETLVLDLLETFRAETDFLREARTMQTFAKHAPDGVVVPKPYPEVSSKSVLVMDYLPSEPVLQHAKKLSPGKRRELAVRLMHVFMAQLMESPLLHADPHPGNYGVDAHGNLVLYDFGNVVPVTPDLRFAIKSFTLAMVSDNVDEALRVIDQTLHLKIVDEGSLKDWLKVYFDYTKTPGLNAADTFLKINNVRTQPVIFTAELTRIMRAFSSLEGVCTKLDPEFQYYELTETFLESILMSQDFMERKAAADFWRLFET